jgi:hypothetical protein
MAVSDYDPRWIDAFKKAVNEPIEFKFENAREATALRQVLYRVRAAMNKETLYYRDAQQANKLVFSVVYVLKDGKEIPFANNTITPEPKELKHVLLRLIPKGAKYDHLLEEKGFKIPEQPDLD